MERILEGQTLAVRWRTVARISKTRALRICYRLALSGYRATRSRSYLGYAFRHSLRDPSRLRRELATQFRNRTIAVKSARRTFNAARRSGEAYGVRRFGPLDPPASQPSVVSRQYHG